ncbi:MAG: HypC/HybG/HupF family hydrogenase formation chaperone [Actinomycetota bacterium]|nr:HypC/HybG/HupF family hydrogenase formation chaperone [Actinomycetota bacterium]
MCLGIPGRVVEMVEGCAGQLALVDVMGTARRVNVGMLEEAVQPGDWIVMHMGFALSVVDEAEAEQVLAGLELLGRPREDAPGWS